MKRWLLFALIVLLLAGGAATGWYFWDKNKEGERESQTQKDESDRWLSVTTQGRAFGMKVPDGWRLTNYPNNFLGGTEVVYRPGMPAIIENSDTEYSGHSLRFRASVTSLGDAGLGPQWSSPQPGLEESTQNFSIERFQGQRYKGVFSQDLNQTIYEYVFNIGGGQKLDIVYTIYHNQNEKDDVVTVEEAIRTIRFSN